MSDDAVALWEREAETFDQAADHGLRDADTRTAWQRLLLPLLPDPPQAIADLGCGTGSLSVLLAQAGHHVHGVDFSPKMLKIARGKATMVSPSPRFIEGDAAVPPLPAGSFDVVLSRHVLWAMADPAAALENWRRLLRVGGRLILIEGDWSTGSGLPAADALALVQQLEGDSELRRLDEPALWGKSITDERYLLISSPRTGVVRQQSAA
ncbi:MAG TPA: class I SAM-dependent methyltransferase [Candidatus Limnocylindria bacterium]|nr:class I SAM-dependent methyltransferase [Candidatus Limnocylindria bacterium]